ncbi:MAG: DUF456 domain-containing protein [Candidatus Eisenbacteria bacterium]|uniref:DUF456 domain-containing protein n=1 Tax=Eiseniibacteriota bacterium TaxID=2212470 RepID=A0A956M0X9_UNCEI|nr:DUF456 domain-containing protein [Candidatus Eisenbacteria bacterium]
MNPVLHVTLLVLLDLGLLAGLLAIPLGLSGNFILLGLAVVVAIATKLQAIGWLALILMAVAVVAGEVVEALLGSLVARKYGASKWGMLGAFGGGLVGAALGTMILPVVGSILGSFLGAAAGAIGAELAAGKGREPGLRAGWGAFLGKVLATAFKTAIGLAIAVYLVVVTH